jgi:hypothetical protein
MEIKQPVNHLRSTLLLITSITTLRVYSQPANLVLRDTIIVSAGDFVARNSITAGPNFRIAATGDAIFRTGGNIYFKPRIAVARGGKFRTVSDHTLVSVRAWDTVIPVKFALQQNYPNPFNPSTNIRFAVKEKSHVSIIVFDMLGRWVATLVNQELPAGEYETRFSPNALASGLYVYRMTTNGFIESRRMLLLK